MLSVDQSTGGGGGGGGSRSPGRSRRNLKNMHPSPRIQRKQLENVPIDDKETAIPGNSGLSVPIQHLPLSDAYTVVSELGRGKFAVVKHVRHSENGRNCAAKFLRKRRCGRDCREQIIAEVKMLELGRNHPRIVQLEALFETSHELILVMEYATGGELFSYVEDEGRLAEAEVVRLIRQLLEALLFLHQRHIVHLDIKPQNLLLTSPPPEGNLKLCDFGFSRTIASTDDVRQILGTPDYVAPEILSYEPLHTSCDMWSTGVLVYVLLTGCSPFAGDSKMETFSNITQLNLDFPTDLFDPVSKQAVKFIKGVLKREPSKRWTALQCLSHPWITGVTQDNCEVNTTCDVKVDTAPNYTTSHPPPSLLVHCPSSSGDLANLHDAKDIDTGQRSKVTDPIMLKSSVSDTETMEKPICPNVETSKDQSIVTSSKDTNVPTSKEIDSVVRTSKETEAATSKEIDSIFMTSKQIDQTVPLSKGVDRVIKSDMSVSGGNKDSSDVSKTVNESVSYVSKYVNNSSETVNNVNGSVSKTDEEVNNSVRSISNSVNTVNDVAAASETVQDVTKGVNTVNNLEDKDKHINSDVDPSFPGYNKVSVSTSEEIIPGEKRTIAQDKNVEHILNRDLNPKPAEFDVKGGENVKDQIDQSVLSSVENYGHEENDIKSIFCHVNAGGTIIYAKECVHNSQSVSYFQTQGGNSEADETTVKEQSCLSHVDISDQKSYSQGNNGRSEISTHGSTLDITSYVGKDTVAIGAQNSLSFSKENETSGNENDENVSAISRTVSNDKGDNVSDDNDCSPRNNGENVFAIVDSSTVTSNANVSVEKDYCSGNNGEQPETMNKTVSFGDDSEDDHNFSVDSLELSPIIVRTTPHPNYDVTCKDGTVLPHCIPTGSVTNNDIPSEVVCNETDVNQTDPFIPTLHKGKDNLVSHGTSVLQGKVTSDPLRNEEIPTEIDSSCVPTQANSSDILVNDNALVSFKDIANTTSCDRSLQQSNVFRNYYTEENMKSTLDITHDEHKTVLDNEVVTCKEMGEQKCNSDNLDIDNFIDCNSDKRVSNNCNSDNKEELNSNVDKGDSETHNSDNVDKFNCNSTNCNSVDKNISANPRDNTSVETHVPDTYQDINTYALRTCKNIAYAAHTCKASYVSQLDKRGKAVRRCGSFPGSRNHSEKHHFRCKQTTRVRGNSVRRASSFTHGYVGVVHALHVALDSVVELPCVCLHEARYSVHENAYDNVQYISPVGNCNNSNAASPAFRHFKSECSQFSPLLKDTNHIPNSTDEIPNYTRVIPQYTELIPDYTEQAPSYSNTLPSYTDKSPVFPKVTPHRSHTPVSAIEKFEDADNSFNLHSPSQTVALSRDFNENVNTENFGNENNRLEKDNNANIGHSKSDCQFRDKNNSGFEHETFTECATEVRRLSSVALNKSGSDIRGNFVTFTSRDIYVTGRNSPITDIQLVYENGVTGPVNGLTGHPVTGNVTENDSEYDDHGEKELFYSIYDHSLSNSSKDYNLCCSNVSANENASSDISTNQDKASEAISNQNRVSEISPNEMKATKISPNRKIALNRSSRIEDLKNHVVNKCNVN